MQKRSIVYKATNALIPYVGNSRTHSEAQVKQIAASIQEFGFTNPILIDENDGIIAGHGRILAAAMVGELKVPCIVLSGLTKAQKKALVIADNQLALNADWDLDKLTLELESLMELDFDMDMLGFDEDFLDSLLEPEGNAGLTDEDAVPDPPENPITILGDIWILGNHRLMCGDSTSIDAVDRLMDGHKADMIFTDPPYNVGFNGRSGKFDIIENDNLSDQHFETFIDGVIATIHAVNPAVYYIWCNWKFYGLLQTKLSYKACIVWAKNVFGLGRGYRHQHEFCLFNGKVDEFIKNETDLWSVKKDTQYLHPTQKPVELSIRAFGNHIKLINVLDLFGGSGSTLIGAHITNRKAFLMELDPKYCDVIIKRWEEYTGQDAVLAETGVTYKETSNV
ncbi:MAG: DNA methyltransferase [Nitrosomonadaceae bacterium]